MNELPTLRQMRYLIAVADRLSFRRAAEDCFVTQPALSDQIRLMEEQIGVQLLERTQRRVMLTPAGESFVQRARILLRDLEDLVEQTRNSQALFAGPLRLGVIPTVAPYLLPRLLRRIRKTLPDLKLFLREEQTARLLQSLQEGKLDLLLLALPVEGSELETRDLYREEFVLAHTKGKIQTIHSPLREKDIAGEKLLLLEEGHCLRDQALRVCRLAGAIESQEFRASSLNTLVQMVANGLGMTLLPALAIDVEIKGNNNLATTPFAPPAPTRRIGLAWRKQSARRKEYEILAEVILKNLPGGITAVQEWRVG